MIKTVQNIDWSILRYIQENFRNTFMDNAMRFITKIGDVGAVWIAIAIIFLFIKNRRDTGVKIAIGLIIVSILGNLVFKNLFARPRPFISDKDIELLINEPFGFSFPSGHSFSSFVAATIIFLDDRKMGYLAMIMAVLIALSRIYLYVHFPSDILAGMLLGILLGVIIDKFYRNDKRDLEGRNDTKNKLTSDNTSSTKTAF